jgi:hypothetical protein
VTNDVSAATGGSSIAAASGSDGAQNVAASAASVTPPAAALNLAMQVGDCLLSAGMSANDVVVAMLGITDAYGPTGVSCVGPARSPVRWRHADIGIFGLRAYADLATIGLAGTMGLLGWAVMRR